MISQTLSRRPLYLKKQLSSLAKDDPQTYAAFVEGVTLLAWNIAWLCKTQGIDVGEDSWEEVSNIGKNLWRLIAAEQARQQPTAPAQEGAPNAKSQDPSSAVLQRSRPSAHTNSPTAFGQWSHDTAYSNLTSAVGSEHMRKWRLQDPMKVIERVKHMLLSDRTGAGWEILEGKEWETESMIRKHTTPSAVVDGSTVAVDNGVAHSGDVQDPKSSPSNPPSEVSQDKTRGTSGWTKLKSR